jgi:hypothetical protein
MTPLQYRGMMSTLQYYGPSPPPPPQKKKYSVSPSLLFFISADPLFCIIAILHFAEMFDCRFIRGLANRATEKQTMRQRENEHILPGYNDRESREEGESKGRGGEKGGEREIE